jgi:sacsin
VFVVPESNLQRYLTFVDLTQTGRFGIGFNSIYHLTDVPCLLTGNNLGILVSYYSISLIL